jgi:hypothetical protein
VQLGETLTVSSINIPESAFVTQLEACRGTAMLGLDGENTRTILKKHVHYSIQYGGEDLPNCQNEWSVEISVGT